MIEPSLVRKQGSQHNILFGVMGTIKILKRMEQFGMIFGSKEMLTTLFHLKTDKI